MRCTQPMGLPKEANEYLRKHAVRKNVCPECQRDDGYIMEVAGYTGMYDDYPLHKYQLENGKWAVESVQETIWSSGPMIWLQLNLPENEVIAWYKFDICKTGYGVKFSNVCAEECKLFDECPLPIDRKDEENDQ